MQRFTGSEIRLLRQMRNLQQKDMASMMKISTQRYSKLENNDARPYKRTIEMLKILNYTPESARELLLTILG